MVSNVMVSNVMVSLDFKLFCASFLHFVFDSMVWTLSSFNFWFALQSRHIERSIDSSCGRPKSDVYWLFSEWKPAYVRPSFSSSWFYLLHFSIQKHSGESLSVRTGVKHSSLAAYDKTLWYFSILCFLVEKVGFRTQNVKRSWKSVQRIFVLCLTRKTKQQN